MIVYMENPMPTKKLLNLINEFGKTAGYKVSTQKSKAFLYTTTKQQKQKSEKNPIRYSNKKNKVPKNKPNQGVKDLFSENYTTLKKEIKEDTNKWKHVPCSWIRRINIIKMAI